MAGILLEPNFMEYNEWIKLLSNILSKDISVEDPSYNSHEEICSAYYSNFFGLKAGYQATSAFQSNFFGDAAGSGATYANRSNFFGEGTGNNAKNAADSNHAYNQFGTGKY